MFYRRHNLVEVGVMPWSSEAGCDSRAVPPQPFTLKTDPPRALV
jgi:hypothetical protein